MKTAVAFFFFRRPGLTARVMATIRSARPPRLYLVADGPRLGREAEAEACAAARAEAEAVDWPCEVVKLYSEDNMGCGRRLSSGITAVFECEEEAIILEDDCVPVPSFFDFCEAMLERHRNDERVMAVCGSNFDPDLWRGNGDWCYTNYVYVWGWASWRRAWQHYDFFMPSLKEEGDEVLNRIFRNWKVRTIFREILWYTKAGHVDTWDHQWNWTIWRRAGLVAIPRLNLVSNLGWGNDATHCEHQGLNHDKVTGMLAIPLIAPPVVELDGPLMDALARDRLLGRPSFIRSVFYILRHSVKRLLGLR